MVGAIVVGLITGAVYSWFMKKNITIKMPDGVPEGVSSSFASLIPALALISGAMVVNGFFTKVFNTTFFEAVYKVLQIPLQNLTDTLPGMMFAVFLISFLWWFGIHGAAVVDGILYGLWVANASSNQALVDAGKELTLANGGHIVTAQFYDQFIVVTGSCVTIGAVLYMAFRSKSRQYRTLGKMGMLPSIFNVNEPILFGTPCVFNVHLFIPMILVPLVNLVIEYFAIYTGLCPLYTGVMVPWTTPVILSGFLIGGWRTALLQLVIILVSVLIYYPFIKKADEEVWQKEIEQESTQA